MQWKGRLNQLLVACVAVLATACSVFAQGGGFGGGAAVDPFSIPGAASGIVASAGWRPWLSINGNYMKTLSASSEQYAITTPASGILSGGIGGSKNWANKSLAGGYTGSVGYFPTVAAASTTPKWRPTQVANLSYAQQLSQRVKVTASQMGGVAYGGYGVASGFGITGVPGTSSSYGSGGLGDGSAGFGDPGLNGVVDNEIFSDRSLFYAANGSLSYLFTDRVAVSFSGGANVVRRESGLAGNNAFSGGARLSYRISQRATIVGGSTYTESSYTSYFGNVRALFHNAGVGYQVSPSMRMNVEAGVGQIKSTFIGQVQLPPEVAALLGVPTSLQVAETDSWSPTYRFSLTKQTPFGSFMGGLSRGLSMGNGITMAGMQDLAVLSFSRTLNSRIGFGLVSSATRSTSKVGVLSTTETAQGGGNLSFRIVSGLSFGLNGGMRYVSVPSKSRRTDIFFGGGISWSPGEQPFRF